MQRVLLFALLSWQAAAETPALVFPRPAGEWNEALPLGNGRLGAMVFGGTADERLQLNDDRVWAGAKIDRINPGAKAAIPEVRRLLWAGKVREAEALADRDIISTPRRMPPYQTLGDLLLHFPGHDQAAGYERRLDLSTATHTVKYRSFEAGFTRECFASAPAQAIVCRIAADRPGKLTFGARLRREADAVVTPSAAGLVLSGKALPHSERQKDEPRAGREFRLELRVVPSGGRLAVAAGEVRVEGADSALLILTTDPVRVPDDFAALRAAHVADYRKFFDRADLLLPAAASAANLYWHYGRYLLISSSRPGTLAATLQGIWNPSLTPPWDSKYTININTEMNYWPAEMLNLAELHEPLFDLVENAMADGRRVAREMYGARGFVLHHNTDAWGHAVPIDGVGSGIWPMGAAWLALHYWDHYDYGRDRAFLEKRGWPVMREAALFLLDALQTSPGGQLVIGPSLSPENRYRTAGGAVGKLTMGAAMDTQITRALFTRAIAASGLLNTDAPLRQQLADALRRLPPDRIGRRGNLQEWLEDYDDPDPGHRHISHLFALHPDDQITLRKTPDLARAARKALELRLSSGGGHTGWSRAWIINFWARLEDAEKAHENIVALLVKSTLPNMLDTHPPFQIDGNFGGTAGISEMLLQSLSGEVHLLPALPAAWSEGSFRGWRARGGLEVDLSWSCGKARRAVLRSTQGGEFVLRIQGATATRRVQVAAGQPLVMEFNH